MNLVPDEIITMESKETELPTLMDILEDKNTYPNDRKITLADGVETTVGELRSGYMKDADYRKKTSDLASQRREFDRQQQEFVQARQVAEAELEALAKRMLTREPVKRDQVQEMLEDNPVGQALMARIEKLNEQIARQDEWLKSAEDRFKQHETVFIANQHRAVLERLQQMDSTLDTDKLVEFAKANHIPRLDHAYKLMTDEERIKKAESQAAEKARKEGFEEGRKAATQPQLPIRRLIPNMDLTDKDPKTFDEAAEAALNDPEIQSIMSGLDTQMRPAGR